MITFIKSLVVPGFDILVVVFCFLVSINSEVHEIVSLEDGHLGQATPHDILYVNC